MLQMATGGGKTLLAAAIIARALEKGRRVVFVVPALSLIDQTVAAFWAEGIQDIGVIQASHTMTNPNRAVQVASVQTLTRRALPTCDLVIVDEAHQRYTVIDAWMKACPKLHFIGLSATPWSKGLGKSYDDLIIAATTQELIDAKFLAPFRVYAPSHPDLSKVRVVAGEYREDDLAKAMDPLVGDVVSTWLERGEGRPTLCFAVDCNHARHLQQCFLEAGVPTGYIDAHTSLEDRKRIAVEFHAGRLKVVTNVGTMTTGVDWDVRCVILARPTKSESLYVQIIGRGLRTADGKADCLILDHSDTTLNLGFVTDVHHDKLDDGKAKKSTGSSRPVEKKPKDCPKCSFVRQSRVLACPSCGFTPVHVPTPVKTLDGELIEMTAKGMAKVNRDAGWDEKRAFIGQLRRYASDTHKKEGWVAYKYKEKFGVWPNDRRVADEPPAKSLTHAVKTWIRSQNIRFAKSNGGHDAHP
jgi:superfamily II DNA or RNA helicase